MIPKDYITAWRAEAPWLLDAQVEQDLVISRAIVNLFAVPELANSLAFRGGTALYREAVEMGTRFQPNFQELGI